MTPLIYLVHAQNESMAAGTSLAISYTVFYNSLK